MKIIQTWDDGLVSDIRLTEILRRHRAKAGFCLTPGLYQDGRSFGWMHGNHEVWRLSIHELTSVYHGFEICSHSMTHPYLTNLSPDRLDWELQTSRRILEEIFHQPILGFCYPFNTFNDDVKDAVRRTGYRWARGTPRPDGFAPCADPFEFHPCCHFLAGDFWELYERQREQNGIFFFWGHSFELVNEAMWSDLKGKIEGISSDPEAQWCFAAELFTLPG